MANLYDEMPYGGSVGGLYKVYATPQRPLRRVFASKIVGQVKRRAGGEAAKSPVSKSANLPFTKAGNDIAEKEGAVFGGSLLGFVVNMNNAETFGVTPCPFKVVKQ